MYKKKKKKKKKKEKNENENDVIRFNFNNGYLYVKEDINSLLNSKVKNTQFKKNNNNDLKTNIKYYYNTSKGLLLYDYY